MENVTWIWLACWLDYILIKTTIYPIEFMYMTCLLLSLDCLLDVLLIYSSFNYYIAYRVYVYDLFMLGYCDKVRIYNIDEV